MGSATAHLVGNVATDLKKSLDNPGHERVSFRVIANDRRREPETGNWVDGDEFSVTVVCWGALARGVAQSIRIGDPVAVSGKLVTRRYELDGQTRFATEVKAGQVAHDLSRGVASFTKRAGSTVAPADFIPGRVPEPAGTAPGSDEDAELASLLASAG